MDALLDLDVDYVVVATPTVTHLPLGLRLAQAGVHALIEKPLTLDADEAGQLTEAFEQRGLIGAVGHIERYNPALQQARDRIEGGQLGEIHQVATRRQGPFPARIGDVGVILDLATHDIDLTAWVSRSEYTAVSARTAHRSGRQHEDLVAITGTLANGTVTNHLVNWLSPMKERVTVITGERGALVADTLTADLTFFENGVVPLGWPVLESFRGVSEGNMTRYAFPKPEPLAVEHERFRDAVPGQGRRRHPVRRWRPYRGRRASGSGVLPNRADHRVGASGQRRHVVPAGRVVRKQSRRSRLLQARCRSILGRQRRLLPAEPPVDREVRVERMHLVLTVGL